MSINQGKKIILIMWPMNVPAYVTEEGKMKVNMFFKSAEYVQLTKIRIKVRKFRWIGSSRHCRSRSE